MAKKQNYESYVTKIEAFARQIDLEITINTLRYIKLM